MPWLAGGGGSWQVQELERRSSARWSRLPAEACLVRTPLRAKAWQEMLADHPDRRLVEWVVRGIQQGFRVGYQCDLSNLRQAWQNLVGQAAPGGSSRVPGQGERGGQSDHSGQGEAGRGSAGSLQPLQGNPKEGQGRQMVDLSSPA